MEIACGFQKAYMTSGCYTLEINSLRNIHPNTKITSFDGVHDKGKTNADVEKLICSKAQMQFVPAGLFQLFAGLRNLTIYNCTLKEIGRQNLAGLNNLMELSITYCPLTKLPDDLFIDTVKLNYVELNNNKIETATSKFLKPFIGRTLQRFDLRSNKTINAHYSQDEGSVKSLKELMELIDEKCGKPEKVDEKKASIEFGAKIRGLWPSGRFSDFEVNAGSKKFQVHKNVLGLQSSVFAKVFDDNRQATELKIPDFSETAVENLLHFMYTGEIKEDSDGIEMFSIASKLEVPELKTIYEKLLMEKLKDCDALTAYQIFLCAHQNASEDLKLQAFKAIEKLFARDLPEDLMNDSERLKAIITKKVELDQMFN